MWIKKRYLPEFNIAICTLIAFVTYLVCPEKYNFGLCVMAMVLYVITFLSFLMKKKLKNYFCFSVIFSIAFFFVYYFYPIMLYPVNKYAFPIFYYNFNDNIITKSTFLATIGYDMFIIGILFPYKDKKKDTPKIHISNFIPTSMVALFCVLAFIKVFALNLSVYFGEGNSSPIAMTIWSYISLIEHGVIFCAITIEFYIALNAQNKQTWYKRNPILWVLLAIYCLITLLSGSRNIVIAIALAVIYGSILCEHGWSLLKLTVYVLIGMTAMSIISFLRVSNTFSFSIENITSDLIINNITLYKGYDYVKSNGIIPFTLIGSLLSAIPFLQGLVVRLRGISIYYTSSARLFSLLILGENASYGVGTNIIASIYLGAGLVGVVVMMFWLGRIVKKYSDYRQNDSIFKLLICFEIMAHAVFLVRADFFYPVGHMSWGIIFLNIFIAMFSKRHLAEQQ